MFSSFHLKSLENIPFSFAVLIGKDSKMTRRMLIFVVANIWNCYNIGDEETDKSEVGGKKYADDYCVVKSRNA